jgi:hypothetical protein
MINSKPNINDINLNIYDYYICLNKLEIQAKNNYKKKIKIYNII